MTPSISPPATPRTPPAFPSRAHWRIILALYTLTLVTATHWPRLAFENITIPRVDLLLHLSAFSALALLALPARLFRTPKNTPATIAVLILFAALDESTQAIPILHRHTSFLDFAADVLGILVGVVLWLGFTRLARR